MLKKKNKHHYLLNFRKSIYRKQHYTKSIVVLYESYRINLKTKKMKNAFKLQKLILGCSLLFLTVSSIAWQTGTATKASDTPESNNRFRSDTTIPKHDPLSQDIPGIAEVDLVLKSLHVQMQYIHKQLDSLHIQLKGADGNLKKQLDENLANINMQKIQQQMELALQKIDLDKLKADAKIAMEQAEIQLKDLDMQKIKIDMEKMKQQLNQANIKGQLNAENIQKQVQGALQNANDQIKKAASELEELKNFISALEKDGLIDRKKGFTIEWKSSGELYINNARQSKQVADKYSKYYHRDGYKITINAEGNFVHPGAM